MDYYDEDVAEIAREARDRERERCAKIAERTSPSDWSPEGMRKAIAEAIRQDKG